jgi:molybdate transport system regulatory protein
MKNQSGIAGHLAPSRARADPAVMAPTSVSLRLRLLFGDRLVFGPGKAELLARIRDTGSIAAAGRAMGMSYKRAWSLVEEMNAAFADPLVASARGGPGGGGAILTPDGLAVLAAYEAMVSRTLADNADALEAIAARLRDMSSGK